MSVKSVWRPIRTAYAAMLWPWSVQLESSIMDVQIFGEEGCMLPCSAGVARTVSIVSIRIYFPYLFSGSAYLSYLTSTNVSNVDYPYLFFVAYLFFAYLTSTNVDYRRLTSTNVDYSVSIVSIRIYFGRVSI